MRLKVSVFLESQSMAADKEAVFSFLLASLIKTKTTKICEQETVSREMQTETSALCSKLKLFEMYSIFCDKMAKSDDTWKFWNIFTDNVMLPYLMLWFGIRFANWELRVAAVKLIARISHALDRTSYLRSLPRHIADIQYLPPSIINHFKSGGFVVNLSGKPFSAVAFDESHEMLINKDIKAAIRRVESEYTQRICPYLPTRARILKTLKSQMNLNRDVLNQSLMQISKKDQDFEQNIRKIFLDCTGSQTVPWDY